MRRALFLIGEVVVGCLLLILLFGALIYQPVWMWVVAPVVVLAGTTGIVFWAKTVPRRAWLLVFLCPLAYTIWFLGLGLSLNSGPIATWPVAGLYYCIGFFLLSVHHLLNAKLR